MGKKRAGCLPSRCGGCACRSHGSQFTIWMKNTGPALAISSRGAWHLSRQTLKDHPALETDLELDSFDTNPCIFEQARSLVSADRKGNHFRRFRGNQLRQDGPSGNTSPPPLQQAQPLVTEPFPRYDSVSVRTSSYPPAHSTGAVMMKHSARCGYHGSIPWPGRGRSQRTRDPYRPVSPGE